MSKSGLRNGAGINRRELLRLSAAASLGLLLYLAIADAGRRSGGMAHL
jgi:hypothetical protein